MSSQKTSKQEKNRDMTWAHVLDENEQWVREILLNRLNNLNEVEDVAQEIKLSLLKSKTQPTELDNPSAWLYRVAVRQVLMYRRKKGRYRKLINNTVEKRENSNAQEGNPLAMLMRTERVEAIQKNIQHLSEIDREILILKYSENWTYKQLAEKLGVSVHTIEHRLVKAKKTLRKLLTNADGEVIV